MLANKTGVKFINDNSLFIEPFWASLIETEKLDTAFSELGTKEEYTRFEKLCLLSAHQALKNCRVNAASADTLFILSTTKGNIDLLEKDKKNKYAPDRIYLWHTAQMIASFFKNPNKPIVICNACISGVLAIITAFDYLNKGFYKNAVVIGADIASEFVIAGFQSFKSMSPGPCKPFDATRDGLNLGEGAGAIILSTDQAMLTDNNKILIRGGTSSNDSNHISGPSRDGEGLYLAVKRAMDYCNLKPDDIGFISAHGTATPFNDEMETKAFAWANLGHAPLNSMKGYFGHTLGAAGIIETIISVQSMKRNILLKTLGYKDYGVPEKINILDINSDADIRYCIKTASGFGGCNAALILEKK